MDALIDFLTANGYWGMLVSAFLAGSVFPLNSELVLGALTVAGLSKMKLLLMATIGNVLGGVFNYWIGSLGRMDWIERYLKVKPEDMDRAKRFMADRGAWMGFFAFLPGIGEVITIVLGFTRASFPITLLSMTLGKGLRYVILIYGLSFFF